MLTGGLEIHKGLKKLENQPISTENLILVDWLTFSSKIWSVPDLKAALGLSDVAWELGEYGRYGYKRREYFGGVSILSEGRLDENGEDFMGVCVECSGQGCRSLETFGSINWNVLFEFLTEESNEFKISRLDLAFDDHTGILDKLQLQLDTDDGNYRSLSRNWDVRYGSKGFSIYHGAESSRIRVRIYDKAAERGLLDGTHWIRVEIMMRDENAFGAATAIAGGVLVGNVYSGILSKYLVYCQECNDSNKSRWPIADYWQELIQGAEPITIAASPGVEYNIFHMEAFLRDTAGGALSTWIEIFGLDSIPELLKKRTARRNPKHQLLLDLHRKEHV